MGRLVISFVDIIFSTSYECQFNSTSSNADFADITKMIYPPLHIPMMHMSLHIDPSKPSYLYHLSLP